MGCKTFLGSLGRGWVGLMCPGCYCLGGCGQGGGIWGGLWFSCGEFLAGAGGWVHFGGESGGEFIILGSFEIFLIFPNFLRS